MSDKVYIKLGLLVKGKEEVVVNVEYKDTTIEMAEALENGLADLIKTLNKSQ